MQNALGEMRSAGWRVHFDRKESYRGGHYGYCYGKNLHVAVGRRDWFPVFVHEYFHFKQAQEGKWLDDNQWVRFHDWLGYRRNVPSRLLRLAYKAVLGCEADAESKSIQLIYRSFKRVDLKRYTQGANVYLWVYTMALEMRRWFMPVVRWSEVPSELTLDVPEWFRNLYVRKCRQK